VGRRRTGDGFAAVDIWSDDPSMQEAISAIRMAADPGEDYDEVAQRIEEEAARYREFLRTPMPIGKITLNAKQVLNSAAAAGEVTGRVYQVRDPAEGRASVFYSFKRSASLVLEVIVHDRNDNPLFPIVRTYSDWLGKRTFNLGAGRTFDLRMSEGDCPGMVRVQTSFNAIGAEEASDSMGRTVAGGLPLAGDDDRGGSGKMNSVPPWSYGRRLTFTLGVECLVLVAFACLFWRLAPNQPLKEEAHAPTAARRFNFFRTYAGSTMQRGDQVARLGVVDVGRQAVRHEAGGHTPAAETVRKAQQKNNHSSNITRIGTVTGGRVIIDDAFCQRVGGICGQWQADLQSALNTVNDLLKSPLEMPGKSGLGSGSMLLSYLTEGPDPGHGLVTLLTPDALYLIRGAGWIKFDGGEVGGFADTTTTLSETVSDMYNLKDLTEQQAGENDTATAEKRAKPSNAE
jgi:hypothetical protein